MKELPKPIIVTSDATLPAVAEAEMLDFWANQFAGVDVGEVVVLRDPGGWDCFTPKAEVADLLAKGFTVAEKTE